MTTTVDTMLAALDVQLDAVLPEHLNWPQLLAWIVRRDSRLVARLGSSGKAERDAALIVALQLYLAGGNDDESDAGAPARLVERYQDEAIKNEIAAGMTIAYDALQSGKMKARGYYLRAPIDAVPRGIPQDVWADARIDPDRRHGFSAMASGIASRAFGFREVLWVGIHFRRDEVLKLWPAGQLSTETLDGKVKEQRRIPYSFADADRPFVESGIARMNEQKISANQAAGLVVGDGTGVPGGGTAKSKATRIAKRISERLSGSQRS